MKKIFLLILFIINCGYLLSQTYDLQFIEINNGGTNGGNFDVKVQIQGSSTFKLASSNITFNFNTAGLQNPTKLTAHNFSGGFYNTMTVTEPNTGVASINITFPLTESLVATDVPTTWIDVVTVRFTILNSSETSNLTFRSANPSPTAVFKCTGGGGPPPDGNFATTELNAGSWSGYDTSLPVELTSLKALVNTNNVNLSWKTSTEVNNNGFEIQREVREQKSEVSSWVKVGFVQGHGNSNSPKEYTYTDKNLTGGTKFAYRLKQIDNDGKYEYSKEVEVEVVPKEYALYQNYPNPFNPTTNIKFDLPEASKVVINVYNILGERVATLLNRTEEAGFHQLQFRGNNLGSGTYIYRIEAGDFVQTKKMLLMK